MYKQSICTIVLCILYSRTAAYIRCAVSSFIYFKNISVIAIRIQIECK